ncbi:MAG: tryptophan synthase subunit alpha [Spirochaetaceae bacterium]|nr:MAG: tryptophan synthase subunit alpha [Spirochaetaceae bacterium]
MNSAATKHPLVMAHMIPGYPDETIAEAAVAGLVKGGATHLEIQFPFSDPTADGPVIQAACARSLENGFKVDAGFEFVGRVAARYDLPVYIMSYASLVYRRTVEQFVRDTKAAGAAGLIIPDLPVDSDEGLYEQAASAGLDVLPVVVPNTPPQRLQLLRDIKLRGVYAALRAGITGSRTEIGQENLEFLQRLRESLPGMDVRVFAGFGIREASQVEALSKHVDGVVIGSALVEVIGGSTPQNVAQRTAEALQTMLGRSSG